MGKPLGWFPEVTNKGRVWVWDRLGCAGDVAASESGNGPRGTVTNDLGNGCETVDGAELTTPHPTGVAGLARRGWRWWARGGESLGSPGSGQATPKQHAHHCKAGTGPGVSSTRAAPQTNPRLTPDHQKKRDGA